MRNCFKLFLVFFVLGIFSFTYNAEAFQINIDPDSYIGTYRINTVTSDVSGPLTVDLVPGSYTIRIAAFNNFGFDVDANGQVTSQNTAAAQGIGDTLLFNNTTVVVDPGSYTGTYRIVGVMLGDVTGVQSAVLMPGVTGYTLRIAAGVNGTFDVASPCAITPSQLIVDGNTFNISCQSLVPVLSCIGFQAPMNDGAVTVKKNRVLPFKAILEDESSFSITDLDIASAPVIQILFDSGIAPAVDVTDDALPAGAGTEGNQFEFNGDKWQYNLKTKNYTAMGTYTVTLQSGDELEYTVDPACTGSFVIEQ